MNWKTLCMCEIRFAFHCCLYSVNNLNWIRLFPLAFRSLVLVGLKIKQEKGSDLFIYHEEV